MALKGNLENATVGHVKNQLALGRHREKKNMKFWTLPDKGDGSCVCEGGGGW